MASQSSLVRVTTDTITAQTVASPLQWKIDQEPHLEEYKYKMFFILIF